MAQLDRHIINRIDTSPSAPETGSYVSFPHPVPLQVTCAPAVVCPGHPSQSRLFFNASPGQLQASWGKRVPPIFLSPTSSRPLVRHWMLDTARIPTSPHPSSIPSPLKTPHTAGGHRLSRVLLQPSLLTLVPHPALGCEAGSVQGPAGTGHGWGGGAFSQGQRAQLPRASPLCGALWGDFALKRGLQEEEAETPGVGRSMARTFLCPSVPGVQAVTAGVAAWLRVTQGGNGGHCPPTADFARSARRALDPAVPSCPVSHLEVRKRGSKCRPGFWASQT